MSKSERQRFTARIQPEGECLVLTGALDRDGYSSIHFRGKRRRAHRLAYWAGVGDIPEGMMIDHTCNNRACVRTDHLRVLTAAQIRRRAVGDLCKNGHPLDRCYGTQRYCSICDAAKKRRLRAKWKAEGRGEVLGL